MVCSGSDNKACNRIAWQMPSGCPPVVPPAIDVLDLCSLPPLPDTSMAEPPLVVPVPEIPGPEIVTCIHVDPKVSISIGKTDEKKSKASFKQSEDDCAIGLYELDIEALLPCPVEIDNQQSAVNDVGAADDLRLRGQIALQMPGGDEKCTLNGVQLDLQVDCPINLPKSAKAVSRNGLPAAVEFKANKGNGCEIGDLDLHIAVPCPINMSMPSMVPVSMYMLKLGKEQPAKLPDASGLLKIHLAKECKLITLHRPIKRIDGKEEDNFSVFTVCDTACGFSGISLKLVVPPGCSDTNYNATASARYNASEAVVKKLQPIKLAVNIGHSRKTIEESAALPEGNTTTHDKTSETASPSCLFSVGLDLELPPIFSCPFDNIRFSVHGPYKIEKSSVKKYSSDASCALEFLFSGPNGECPFGFLSFTAPGRYGKMGFKLIKEYSKTDEGQCAARFRFTGPSIHNAVVKQGSNVKVTPKQVPYTPTANKMTDPGGGVDGQEFTIDVDCMLDKLSIATTGIAKVARTRKGPSCNNKFEIDVPCPFDKFSVAQKGIAKVKKTAKPSCGMSLEVEVPCPFDKLSVAQKGIAKVTKTVKPSCGVSLEVDVPCPLDKLSIPSTNTIAVTKSGTGCAAKFLLSVKSDNLQFHDISGAGMAKVYKKGDPFHWIVSVPQMSVDGVTGNKDVVCDVVVHDDGLYKKRAVAGYSTGLLKSWTESAEERFVEFKEFDDSGDTCVPLITSSSLSGTTAHKNGGTRVTLKNCDGSDDRTFDVWNGNDGKDGKDGDTVSISTSSITGGTKVTITYGNNSTSFDVMDGKDGQTSGYTGNFNVVNNIRVSGNTIQRYTVPLTFKNGLLTTVGAWQWYATEISLTTC